MSYRVYVRNDYRPEIRWCPDQPWYRRKLKWILCFCCASLASIYLLLESTRDNQESVRLTTQHVPAPSDSALQTAPATLTVTPDPPKEPEQWQTVTVKPGENLSLIFDHLHLSPSVLHEVLALGQGTAPLQKLTPGEHIHFRIGDGDLQALKYEPNLTTTLLITGGENKFRIETITSELETHVTKSTGLIRESLYQAGLDAGLSEGMVMRLISIYGWDIDFALDIRKGDQFKIIYEEKYKQGKKVADGSILGAEFTNQGKTFKAVRYTSPEGLTGYFNEEGYSMRKAFLRTPLKFNHISSGFSLSRKHPILNLIRAHRGVDYAAPSGTPVKAAGDGNVVELGRNGGYGNIIVLRHAGIYQTVYAHLSGFAKGLRRGQHVEQGDIIGYVGKTGLATGPHLHYEFRVNGVHQNPLTVTLPKALRIESQQIQRFQQQTRPLFAQLDREDQTEVAALSTDKNKKLMLALDQDKDDAQPSVR